MIHYENIFFDFDGVILESVASKSKAFASLYSPYGEEVVSKVMAHHKMNGGVSRYEKFRVYHTEYLGQPVDKDKIDELADQFSKLVKNKVIESPEVGGAFDFIKKYHKSLNFWIITGTPTNEIKEITEARKLTDYFIGIHGSPQKKPYWTEFLIKKHGLDRKKTLFLGDATTDYQAAQASRIDFALRETEENEDLFANYTGIRFKDFMELETKLAL